MGRTAWKIGVALVGTAAVSVTAGTAQAAPAQSATADVTSGAFHLKFTAQRAADAPVTAATGTFEAETTAGPLSLMKVAGPVTCLDVRGNTMGLFYPVTKSTPSTLADAKTGIFIYLTVDGAGQATNVGFVPVPYAKTESCAPGATPLPAMGSATLNGNVVAPTPTPAPTPRRFAPKISTQFSTGRKSTRVRKLQLSLLPAGSSVTVTCRSKAKGCPFSTRRASVSNAGIASVSKLFGRARLRPGAIVKVKLAAPGFADQTLSYTVRKSKPPKRSTTG